MDSPVVDNKTDFKVHPQLLLDRDGEKLCVMVKATFERQHDGAMDLAPAARMRPMRFADIPWEKPKPESIAYPGDVCLRKPGTDVVCVANACAPGGRPVPAFDVRIEVGPLRKSLVVFGRRLWVDRGAGLTSPGPIGELAMRYDYAWGGRDDADPTAVLEEPRNPIGLGVTRSPASLTHQTAPSIEDPAFPIRSAKTAPPPAGIGAIGRSWSPRRKYAGTYDQPWKEFRSPLMPDDFDDRYNLCASPGLIADEPLGGGEPVRLLNLAPGGGAVTFDLPKVSLAIEFRVKDRPRAAFAPHLDTLVIDALGASPEKPLAVEMVWRAYVKAPRRMKDARVIVCEVTPR